MRQYPKTFNNNWPCTGLIKAALPIPLRRLGIVITQNQRFFTIQTPAQTCHFRFISKSEIPKNEHPVLPGYSFIPVLNDLLLHISYILKRTIFKTNHRLMPKMRVRNKKNVSSHFLFPLRL